MITTILDAVMLLIICEATVSYLALGTTMINALFLLETSQILVLTVLFNTKTPANSKPVFVFVLRLVNFDLFRTENLYVDIFEEAEPLNQTFEDCGFDTSNFIVGLGPLFFVIVFFVPFRLLLRGLRKITP